MKDFSRDFYFFMLALELVFEGLIRLSVAGTYAGLEFTLVPVMSYWQKAVHHLTRADFSTDSMRCSGLCN